jgi:UDP-N-acetyl-2-amino-2-deoxyglucuronate dehydrogenase
MTIHLGIIGGGNISETHALAARAIPEVSIAAVYGSNSEKVSRLGRVYDARAYSDFDAFLAHRPMDLVIIGSPSGLHATQGVAAARCGLHVLTEKPIDISTVRADALIQAAKQSCVKLGVIFQDRLKPHIRTLKQWISEDVLGDVLLIDAQVRWYRPGEYYGNSRWRGSLALDGGGALINQAVHTVDLLVWLLGDVARVRARTARVLHNIEGEDTAVAILDFSSGALGVLQATTAAYPGYPRRIEITGSKGTVVLEHDRIIAADLRAPGVAVEPTAFDENKSASSAVVSDFRGHQAVFEDFIAAINRNGTPACDGREGRRSLSVIEAIYHAAQHPELAVPVDYGES